MGKHNMYHMAMDPYTNQEVLINIKQISSITDHWSELYDKILGSEITMNNGEKFLDHMEVSDILEQIKTIEAENA